MSTEAKQIVVMRNDLNMRKGKMCAQAAHASIAFITNKIRITDFQNANPGESGLINLATVTLKDVEREWIEGRFVKICVKVSSEDELVEIHEKATQAGLVSYLIQDAGLTEFGGVSTYTCCGIGPDYSDLIDPITGPLQLI